MPIRDPVKRAENRRQNYLKNRTKEIASMRSWQASNPERHAASRRKSHLLLNYGITPETYEEILGNQNKKCAICDRLPKEGELLHVDHRHADGVVRGLLCGPCNRAIGLISDDVEVAKRLVRYLLR